MPETDLGPMLSPRSVAVVGASDTPNKVGSSVFRNLTSSGFAGPIYPVNSRSSTVQGRAAYGSLSQIGQPIDLVVICTPAATVPALILECGELGIRGVVVLTAGFRELGESGRILEAKILEEKSKFPSLRIIGPNCVGIVEPKIRLSASFALGMPAAGSVAFISQSGALCTAILDWALLQGVGFSHFISLGNQLDVGFADLLDYLAEDPETTSAILYIESVVQSRYFMAAAKKFASRKPLIAYKAGRFAQSAKAAASHTGAMAGVDAVYDAAMKRAGIVRVFDMQSLFACAELLTLHPQAIGPRLAIVTNAGGPGVMATDTLLEENGRLAELAPETIKVLNAFLPANWSRANPVDVIGDADAERISKAVTATLADPNVDTVLALLTPQAMTHPTQSARALAAISIPPGKAILASLMGGEQIAEGRRILQQSGIPTFETPEQAIHGLMHLIDYSKRRDSLTTIVDNKPIPLAGTREERRRYVDDLAKPSMKPLSEMGTSARTLTEPESKQLLVRYGIPTTPIRIAPTASEAVQAAEELGFPVVLKILSPHISHKTDVGGVALNLATATQVRESFERMIPQARSMRPEAELLGVTVQPMIAELHGVELILGAKQDPVFGSVIMMGTGGIHAEIYRDRSLELPPIDRSLALRMLQNLRCWPLLQGYRGATAANIEAVAELITRFSAMIVEQPRILECDLNPLVVSSSQVIVLDARFVIGNSSFSPADPYSHLAIAPEN